jgi:hypothetical protein
MTTPPPAAAEGLDRETLRAYESWLARTTPASFDPYYSQEILRFGVRDEDVLVGPGDVAARPASCGSLLESARAGVSTTVCGIDPKSALACFAALDGAHTVSRAREASGVPASTWELFIAGTFGSLSFAPLVLADLERRVSYSELVRFPGSPYELVREYWENMSDVRARLDAAGDSFADIRRFAALLQELNALAHVGASGRSFYRPASPVVAKGGAAPGTFWLAASVTEETPGGTRFVSGPRVGAALIGGDRYQALLTHSVGDVEAMADAREVSDEGVPWGRIVTARADADEHSAPWFCPPRPFGDEHLEATRAAWVDARAAAQDGRPADAVRRVASVHWRLVRLHPFMSGNQSVAMALVNAVLRRAFGAGMPHLVLDHLALRLSLSAYERVFERAVGAWLVVDENPVRRALELATRRRRLFAFLEELRQVREDDVPALLAGRASDAALAFLSRST